MRLTPTLRCGCCILLAFALACSNAGNGSADGDVESFFTFTGLAAGGVTLPIVSDHKGVVTRFKP